jgi:dimethylamine/trimethylamine dehydrogenase
MSRDPKYDILFEPLKIGPVTAPNRFYQVPHCCGMGYMRPQMMAAMRGIKAEGGWGVVCTEYCSIHPSSDDMPFPHASIWDKGDIKNLRLMTDAVHAHGSLAGIELWHGGQSSANLYTRQQAISASSRPNDALVGMPLQTQAMTKDDITELRKWHKAAAQRAIEAGFDIVYVYTNHGYLLNNFLSAEWNRRDDEYGGSPENRVRLIREIIEDTLEVVKGRCAVAVRYSIPAVPHQDPDDLVGMFSQIAELPDLWDITVTDYALEMGTARFVEEASNQLAVAKIKSLTSKPVVSVGRFTSPDTMLKQITSGTQDFIGAARPSIADPFLPNKIKHGRPDDIRECIGCNVCYAHDSLNAPIRCTQNPTMGEEWRRGWHPERIAKQHADESVLVIGSGPAGLEAACALGQRGYAVTIAEAERELGGRINQESRLPGMSEVARVRDWRLGQLAKMDNVAIYPSSLLDAEAILELSPAHVFVATGAHWRTDGVGRHSASPFDGFQDHTVVSVEDIMGDEIPDGRAIIYDDDHYSMGNLLALKLRQRGIAVTLITPASLVGGWHSYTDDQAAVMRQLIDAGIDIIYNRGLLSWQDSTAQLECVFTGSVSTIEAEYLVPVTSRIANDSLWHALQPFAERFKTLQRIGDCAAPGLIAHAVYAGHQAARELGAAPIQPDDKRRERMVNELKMVTP